MSHNSTCIFCRIIAGEIPASRVLETDKALAFLDVGPLKPGHTLLIPKQHHARLPELPDDLAAATALLLPRLCRAIQQVTQADGLNVLVNVGPDAGQSVEHVHWHIIPRHGGDAIAWPWHAGRYPEGELETTQAAIRDALSAS